MRLLDQIAQAREPVIIVGRSGEHILPGSADRAAAVAACPLRFVLEPDATIRCRELARNLRTATYRGDAPRMPAGEFWAEWTEDDGRRTGVLVRAEPDGGRGTIETFWEQASGEPDVAQAIVRFDLVEPIAAGIDGNGCVGLHPGAHPLARHLVFEIDARWLTHFFDGGQEAALRGAELVVSNLVPGVEMLLAFATLLSARPVLATREVDQSRFRRTRADGGRMALLDHVEVRLDLAHNAALARDGQASGARAPVRCHQVRGHLVHRGDRIFWRRPHLRGDASRPIASRTVCVTARRRGQIYG